MPATDTSPTTLAQALPQPPRTLACSEVWGGNRHIAREVRLPGLAGWLCSTPLEDEGGGDVHYLSVCDYDNVSRIALADVAGHGRLVSESAETLHGLMRRHVNRWDQSDFMRELNQAFRGHASPGKYATALVLSYNRAQGRLAFTNAGHLPPLWRQAGSGSWTLLEESGAPPVAKVAGLPVGLIPGTDYHQTVVTLAPGDLLVLYTDALVEAENAAGEDVGRERLLAWAREAPTGSPAAVGQYLLDRLDAFRGGVRCDDETLLVLERLAEPLTKVWASILKQYALRALGR